MGLDASAYKRSVILVSVCIVFIRLFVFIIVWISCVEIRMRKLTFRSPETIMLKDISLAFFNGPCKKVLLKFGGRYTQKIRFLLACGISIKFLYC